MLCNRMEHHDGNDEENIMSKEVSNVCKWDDEARCMMAL